MANEYLVNSADMTAVADAIRTKGGTFDALVFPDGFVNAVGAIEAGGVDTLGSLLSGTLESYTNEDITKAIGHVFQRTTGIKHISLPNLKSTNWFTFQYCTTLETVYIPKLANLQGSLFLGCTALKEFITPVPGFHCDGNTFEGCTSLTLVDAQYNGTETSNYWYYLGANNFAGCSVLETLILRLKGVPYKLNNVNALSNTPIANGAGYIYVPSDLVDTYKAETNWTTYADQIRAIEDYPEITGG